MDTHEHVTVHMCGFDGIRRGNYFRGRLVRRTGVEVRVRKLRNRKDAIKGGHWRDRKGWRCDGSEMELDVVQYGL